jgi:hypothetical protein
MIWKRLVLIETSHEVGAIVECILLLSIVSRRRRNYAEEDPADKAVFERRGLRRATSGFVTVEQIYI